MAPRRSLLTWLPRILGAAIALFFAVFAADALNGPGGMGARFLDLLMHLLPSALCGSVVWAAWRHEWIGALVFGALALVYTWWAVDHVQWILLIGGPLLLVAVLYGIAWRMGRSKGS